MVHRGLSQDVGYPRCTDSYESIYHVLRNCSFANGIWAAVNGFDTSEF
ncbi:hypothetical protein LINPERHAP1_LOCUS15195 [Linum perenne]